MIGYRAKPIDRVRMGFIGVGGQGSGHVGNFLKIENVEIRAVCDIVESKVARIQKWVQEAGGKKPEGYSLGEFDFKRMCQRDDLDLVFIATPWRWHVPMCLEAMNTGKHAAVEVPAAVTIDECWQLVVTSEKTRKHCVMMENCCYDRIELMILNMVRHGVLGELICAECGYLHDLRGVKFDNQGEGLWRRAHSIKRNGDLYPTHGLGPIAQCMNINRGNQFDYLVSMATKSRGLKIYSEKIFGADSPHAKQKYALGDVVTSMIRTVNGETIIVKHDTNSPRPYSRDILVQGTKGIIRKYPKTRVHIEGISEPHNWDDVDSYLQQYDHPLWKSMEEISKGAGHGGMDFIEDYRLIECLRKGLPMDMDVYDAAAWSVVSELSERSIAAGSRPMKFPDFTRGKWKQAKPLQIDNMT
jgi:predicted dehydrogenase